MKETLEEVAEKYAEHQLTGIDDKFYKFECINDFIAGAKWQQDQLCNSEIIQRIKATKSDAEARRIIKSIWI
jgi:hypothetical protein